MKHNKLKLILNFYPLKLNVVLIFLSCLFVKAQEIDVDSTIVYISEGSTVFNQKKISGKKIKFINQNSTSPKKLKTPLITKKKHNNKLKKKEAHSSTSKQIPKKKKQSSFFYKHELDHGNKIVFAILYTLHQSFHKVISVQPTLNEVNHSASQRKLNVIFRDYLNFLCSTNSSFFTRPPPDFFSV